ncbi:MAG: MFS transporter [Armatimonadota bacterium]|nr:MFS transporter [bacterium]
MRQERKIFGVSKTVFELGIVSFLTDVSSEMLVPIVPLFLRFVLGAPGEIIGLIEGVAESTAYLLRIWAGYLADRFGRPKLLTTIGYGLSALSKPFLIFATSWPYVFGVRFADRFGKGVRSAPRDVLIADATDEAERGRAFGFHRAMDTAGATMGPLVVLALVWFVFGKAFLTTPSKGHADIYRLIFIAATVPAVFGWIVLTAFVPERRHEDHISQRPKLSLSSFDRRFKLFLLILAVFAIGNSSDAFLILRATSTPIGMNLLSFLGVYVAFNALSSVVALRSGVLSDRIGRKPVIIAGWLVFAISYMGIALSSTSLGIWVWFVIYGAYYGMTEGMLRAFAVDLAPANLRGTAIGAFYTVVGLAALPASLIAGFLWQQVSHSAPFFYGAATSLLATGLFVTLIRTREAAPVAR